MPVKPVDGEVRAVWGPTRKRNKWQVVIQTIDGVKHARTISAKTEADTWADAQRARIATCMLPVQDLGIYKGERGWWDDALASKMQTMLIEQNAFLREMHRKELDSMSKAAQAATKLTELRTLEHRLAELERTDQEDLAKRKHGPRARLQNRPTREAPRPGTPIR